MITRRRVGHSQPILPLAQCAGHWRVKANGADVKGGMVNVFTVADGQIAHYEVHADTHAFATALEGV